MNMLKRLFSKLRKRHKENTWILEPKYKLFYVNLAGNRIRMDKKPKNVIRIEVFADSFVAKPYQHDYVGLNPGELIKIRQNNYDIKEEMSLLIKSAACSDRYISYTEKREFVEIEDK